MKKSTTRYPPEMLESFLAKDGPLPAARMSSRFLALVLDWILMSLVASFFIWKIFMPQAHPGAYEELQLWYQEVIEWYSEDEFQNDTPFPHWNKNLESAIQYSQLLLFIFFWLYFALGEVFYAGNSLGKGICRVRSISLITLERPGFFQSLLRTCIKALALTLPIVLFITTIVLLFNRKRQTGHDLISSTAVIEERYAKQ